MSKQILIIDDEESIRESLAEILEDEGFSASMAPSPQKRASSFSRPAKQISCCLISGLGMGWTA